MRTDLCDPTCLFLPPSIRPRDRQINVLLSLLRARLGQEDGDIAPESCDHASFGREKVPRARKGREDGPETKGQGGSLR